MAEAFDGTSGIFAETKERSQNVPGAPIKAPSDASTLIKTSAKPVENGQVAFLPKLQEKRQKLSTWKLHTIASYCFVQN